MVMKHEATRDLLTMSGGRLSAYRLQLTVGNGKMQKVRQRMRGNYRNYVT